MNQLKGSSVIAEAIRIFLLGVIMPLLMAWFSLVPPLFASEQTDDSANQTREGKAEQESSGLQKQQRWAECCFIFFRLQRRGNRHQQLMLWHMEQPRGSTLFHFPRIYFLTMALIG